MESGALSKEDLLFLIDTYQNSIQLNTTLLEKQNQVLETQQKLIEQQDKIINKQIELCKRLEIVATNIGTFSENFITTFDGVDKKLDTVKEDVAAQAVSAIKDHSNLNTKIYVAFGAMGTIILSLMALLYNAYTKFETLEGIARHLGVN